MALHSHSYVDTMDVTEEIGAAEGGLQELRSMLERGLPEFGDLMSAMRRMADVLEHTTDAVRKFVENFNEYRREAE